MVLKIGDDLDERKDGGLGGHSVCSIPGLHRGTIGLGKHGRTDGAEPGQLRK